MVCKETVPTGEFVGELIEVRRGGTAEVVLVIANDGDGTLANALTQAATAFDIVVEIIVVPSAAAFHYCDVDELVETPAEEPIPLIVWPESSRFSDMYALPNIDMECKPVPLWQHLNQPGNKVHKSAPGGPRSRQSGTSHRRHH